ncbi:MAG: hypothetical protein ACI90C_000941 [Rhodoferax sp.]
MQLSPFHRQPQYGTSLIEVLVTLLVLLIGMVGMSKIQALLIREGTTANNRTMAISLAQEKLEDLRGFKWMDAASAYGENCGVGVFCYTEIATPDRPNGRTGGGHEAAVSGRLLFPSGNVEVGHARFERTWFVVDHGNFKGVKVVVSWRDQNGYATEALETAIAPNHPATNAFGAASSTQAVAGPKRQYTAVAAPDVVPITLGDRRHRASSQALTVVNSNGLSVVTQFSASNYSIEGEQSREDYLTLACHCQFATPAAANPPGYFSYVIGKLTVQYPRDEADQVIKVTGIPVDSEQREQPPLCHTCCVDHHDRDDAATPAASASTALFDPERPSADYTPSGNHKHYSIDSKNPQMTLGEVPELNGNVYLEACRFLRVDGIYRIMQDWRLVEVTVMPEDYLASTESSVTPPPALASYQAFVRDVVTGQVIRDAGGTENWDRSGLPPRDLTLPEQVDKQLLTRGIYVDKVFSAPRTLNTGYYSAVLSGAIGLGGIPFSEVGLTSLSSWVSSNPSVVSISNDANSRGRAFIQPGSGSTANISASVLPSNSGLTGGITGATHSNTADYATDLTLDGTVTYDSALGIDRHDHRSALRKDDSLTLTRSATD